MQMQEGKNKQYLALRSITSFKTIVQSLAEKKEKVKASPVESTGMSSYYLNQNSTNRHQTSAFWREEEPWESWLIWETSSRIALRRGGWGDGGWNRVGVLDLKTRKGAYFFAQWYLLETNIIDEIVIRLPERN